jgi:hypothetical protein
MRAIDPTEPFEMRGTIAIMSAIPIRGSRVEIRFSRTLIRMSDISLR